MSHSLLVGGVCLQIRLDLLKLNLGVTISTVIIASYPLSEWREQDLTMIASHTDTKITFWRGTFESFLCALIITTIIQIMHRWDHQSPTLLQEVL